MEDYDVESSKMVISKLCDDDLNILSYKTILYQLTWFIFYLYEYHLNYWLVSKFLNTRILLHPIQYPGKHNQSQKRTTPAYRELTTVDQF